MPSRNGSAAPGRRLDSERTVGMAAIRRLTQATAVTVVGAVAVMFGYVAHALPGRHVGRAAPATTSTTAGGGSTSGGPGAGDGLDPTTSSSAPSTTLQPPTSPTTARARLSPPPAPPRSSYTAPQVVSGSS